MTGVLPGGPMPALAATGSCSSPFVAPASGGTFTGTTSGSSALAGSCGSSGSSPEHVYRWTPSASGTASIRTCSTSGTRYDTVLHVHRTTCTGTEVGCNDDTSGCAVGDGSSGADHHGSRIDLSVTSGETYFIAVDGFSGRSGNYTLTITPPGTGGTPDLVPQISSVSVDRNASVSSGDVAEGCAERLSGVDLLRFTVTSHNIGTAALVLGDPNCPTPCTDHPLEICDNPNFLCSPAQGHNHPHYTNYARYELVDGSGQTVVVGHKQGYCLQDGGCPNPVFTCGFQGLTPGCSDVYATGLGCQYIDITGVPGGSYILRVTLDPFGQIPEDNEANNVATVLITLSGGATTTTISATTTTRPPTTSTSTSTTLPGGSCGTQTVIPAAGGVFTGSTSGSSRLGAACGASELSPERVFTWTPATSGLATFETCGSGTSYDSVLYLRQDTCTGTDLGCNDDTVGCTISGGVAKGSRVIANVTAGTPYAIVVDGWRGAAGSFSLKVTPPGGTTTTTIPFPGCSGATVIPAAGGTFTGTTSGGTSANAGACGSSGTSPERIFSWTPARSGTATIQTCGSGTTYDSIVYVRQGCGGPEIGCNDDTAGCTISGGVAKGSRTTMNVNAGETYVIVVDGYRGQSGTFSLQVTPP